jgi:hypothetical protein
MGSLGSQEAAYVGFLGLLGYSSALSMTASLLFNGVKILFAALGSLLILERVLRRARPDAPQP